MDLGNECRILCDKEIDDYCRLENFGKILYIMGIGFDHRMNTGLSKFAEMNSNLEVWAIEHSRGGWSKDTKQIELEKKNVLIFENLIDSHNWKLTKWQIQMWKNEAYSSFFIAEVESLKYIKERQSEIEKFDKVILDISALPRSIYFNFIRGLYTEHADKLDISILVSENSAVDMSTHPIENAEKAHDVAGFSYNREPVSSPAIVWIPVLGESEEDTLNKEWDYLKSDQPEDIDVFPVVPFPSRNVRRADIILGSYRKQLFSTWEVEKRNIVYASEDNPYQIARKLISVVRNYSKVMYPLKIDNIECSFVFSAISSKLMRLGTLLAVLDLKEQEVPTRLIDVANRGYCHPDKCQTSDVDRSDRLFLIPLKKGTHVAL